MARNVSTLRRLVLRFDVHTQKLNVFPGDSDTRQWCAMTPRFQSVAEAPFAFALLGGQKWSPTEDSLRIASEMLLDALKRGFSSENFEVTYDTKDLKASTPTSVVHRGSA